jgi:aminopeptidase N
MWPGRAYQRFKDAGNMTDRYGALAALVQCPQPPWRSRPLERFHALFRHEALVIDKWFTLQAGTSEHGRQGLCPHARL